MANFGWIAGLMLSLLFLSTVVYATYYNATYNAIHDISIYILSLLVVVFIWYIVSLIVTYNTVSNKIPILLFGVSFVPMAVILSLLIYFYIKEYGTFNRYDLALVLTTLILTSITFVLLITLVVMLKRRGVRRRKLITS
jgi:FtsH-binding integral membrane protein